AISFNERIEFDPKKCFECGLCVVKCPTDAIEM
ncbi:MAG TPA: hypothetical protein DDW82_08370, partial [Acholeplasmataceae bacterium]|nr:hypothetical protein [Acholeplasmataceae bacterium]